MLTPEEEKTVAAKVEAMRPEIERGAAFPINGSYADNQDNGMSLRDYFAAHALAEARIQVVEGFGVAHTNISAITDMAYEIADSMLKRRSQ